MAGRKKPISCKRIFQLYRKIYNNPLTLSNRTKNEMTSLRIKFRKSVVEKRKESFI